MIVSTKSEMSAEYQKNHDKICAPYQIQEQRKDREYNIKFTTTDHKSHLTLLNQSENSNSNKKWQPVVLQCVPWHLLLSSR